MCSPRRNLLRFGNLDELEGKKNVVGQVRVNRTERNEERTIEKDEEKKKKKKQKKTNTKTKTKKNLAKDAMEHEGAAQMFERLVTLEKHMKAYHRWRAAVTTIVQIFVMTETGTPLSLKVESSDSVGSVKAKLWTRLGVQPQAQRLLFGFQELQDDRALASYP